MKSVEIAHWISQPKKPLKRGKYLVKRSFTGRDIVLLWDGEVWRYADGNSRTSLEPGDKWRKLHDPNRS